MNFILLTINGTASTLMYMSFLFMLVQEPTVVWAFRVFMISLVVCAVTPNKSELQSYKEMWK